MSQRNVVLVTGGAGFLGQHVVKLLQTKADHVTEIRVLDVVPYVNQLGHNERMKVTSYTGSITDYSHVTEACQGVDCVMHLAGFVETRLIPDEQLSFNINVKGTDNVIRACKEKGVKRLIHCSTMDVVIGQTNNYDGNEDNTEITPDNENFFPVYGPTKAAAERLVLQANSPSLRTLAIRPALMYGELDYRYTGTGIAATRIFGCYFRIGIPCGAMLHSYVGNVAWSFICADKTLLKETDTTETASGNAYFIADETPAKDMFSFLDPIFKDAGSKPFPVAIPLWVFIYSLTVMYFIFTLLRLVVNVNSPYGIPALSFLKTTHIFSYGKATRLMDYRPLFTVDESHKATVGFVKQILEGKHLKAS